MAQGSQVLRDCFEQVPPNLLPALPPTFESREIKMVCLADLPEEERKKLCRPEQLDKDGNYRIPKILKKARERGFDCPIKMNEADKKAEEEKKVAETEDLKQQIMQSRASLEELASIQRRRKDDDTKSSDDLKKQVALLNQSVIDTIATIKTQQEKNDERFDKLLNLILSKK